MDRHRLEELWARYVSDDPLGPQEKEELLTALASDEALRTTLLKDEDLEGLLRAMGRSRGDAADFARRCANRLGARQDGVRFARDVWQRIESRAAVPGDPPRKTRRGPARRRAGVVAKRPWAIAALAGGVLGVALAVILAQGSPPDTTRPRADAGPRPHVRGPADAPGPANRPADARQQAEQRLAQLREQESAKERDLERAKEEDLRRKAEEAFAQARAQRQEAERRLAEAKAAEARAAGPAAPAASPAERDPSAKERPATRSIAAKLESVVGEVNALLPSGKRAARGGEELQAGEGIETVGIMSQAVVRFPDGTRLEAGPDTEIREMKDAPGKRVDISRGAVRAVVPRQPKDQSLVFLTPHGEATVLGTTLRIYIDPDPKRGTWLEVDEGKVNLKNLAGKAAVVSAGHFAVATTGVELTAKAIVPRDEILLLPQKGILKGSEWLLVKDVAGAAGCALEAQRYPGPEAPPGVAFTFLADAGKEYAVWVRGRAVVTDDQAQMHDSFEMELPNAALADPQKGPVKRAFFDAYCLRPGYWWVGADPKEDGAPTFSVRFARPGLQTLNLHAAESPMRIDAIWLSATQKTRPRSVQTGPTTK